MKAGYQMNVFSRTKAKCDGLVEAGAKWYNTPESLAKNSNIIFRYVGLGKSRSGEIDGN